MKSLIAGLVLILLIGIGGFIYRNVQERTGQPKEVACTMEAKICPDGSSVGRTGPNCEFAACPAGNVATVSAVGISFTLPDGYTQTPAKATPEDKTLLAVYEKLNEGGSPNSFLVRGLGYLEGDGQTMEKTIVASTLFETSDMPATSISQFKKEVIKGRTFYMITVDRFEGVVHTLYYLPRPNRDLLVFEVVEREVSNWTDPKLDVEKLPGHQMLLDMLASLQLN